MFIEGTHGEPEDYVYFLGGVRRSRDSNQITDL